MNTKSNLLKTLIAEEVRKQLKTRSLKEGWGSDSIYLGSREGTIGVATFNGKPVIKYEWDYDSGAFWVSLDPSKGQSAFNTKDEMYKAIEKAMKAGTLPPFEK